MNTRPAASLGTRCAPRRRGVLYGCCVALVWGGQSVVSRQSALDGLSTMDVAVLRFAVSGLVLAPLAWRRAAPFPVGALGWRRAVVLTLLGGAPYALVLVGGAGFAPALHSAVITPGLAPLWAALFAALVAGERPKAAQAVGLALVLAGVAIFASHVVGVAPGREGAWRGDLLFALAAMMWSGYGMLARRWSGDALGTIATVCVLSLAATLVAALVVPLHIAQAPWRAVLLQAGYQGMLAGTFAFFLYTRTLAILGPAQAALFLPLVPVVTAVGAAIGLGEWPSAAELVGMVCVIAGMFVALRAGQARA